MPFDPQVPGNSFFSQISSIKTVKDQIDAKVEQLAQLNAQKASLEAEIQTLQISLNDLNSALVAIVTS